MKFFKATSLRRLYSLFTEGVRRARHPVAIVLAAAVATVGPVSAETYTWLGGNGTWSQNPVIPSPWANGADWQNGGTAIFGFSAGAVGLPDSAYSADLVIQTSGYSFNATHPDTSSFDAVGIDYASPTGSASFNGFTSFKASAANTFHNGVTTFTGSQLDFVAQDSSITGGTIHFAATGNMATQGNAIKGGTLNFTGHTAILQVMSSQGITGGTQTFSGQSAELQVHAQSGITGGEQFFTGTDNSARIKALNGISGGTQTFSSDDSSIHIYAVGGVSGGHQILSGAHTEFHLEPNDDVALGGGSITGGQQTLSGDYSEFHIDTRGSLDGGFQELTGAHTRFDVEGGGKLTGGVQQLSGDNSEFHVQSGGVISGGTQVISGANATFYLEQGATITGGTIRLQRNSTFLLENSNTNASGANLLFDNSLGGVGGTLKMEGHTVTVGSLHSWAADSGRVTNGSGQNTTLTIATHNDQAIFDGSITNGDSGTLGLKITGTGRQAFSGVNFYTGGTEFAGGILRLDGSLAIGSTGTLSFTGGTLQFSSANQTDYSTRFNRNGGQQIRLDTNGQTVGIGDLVTGAGTSLHKIGAGTLDISSFNQYTGGTFLEGGTLGIRNGRSLSNGEIWVTQGAIRAFGAAQTLDNTLKLNGTLEVGRVTNFIGPVDLLSDSTISTNNPDYPANDNSSFTGTISGNHSLTIKEGLGGIGTGAIVFSGTNTYSGGTILDSGRLQISSDVNLGTGSLTFAGGELRVVNSLTLARTVIVGDGGGMSLLDTQDHTVSVQRLQGFGELSKTGTGQLTIAGDSVLTGQLYIAQGTFHVNGGVTMQFGDGGNLGGGLGGDASVAGVLAFNHSNASNYGRNASGSGLLLKAGSGVLTLSGSNDLTGGYVLQGGTLSLGSADALGHGSGFLYFEGGTLQYTSINSTDYSPRFSNQTNQFIRLDTQGGVSVTQNAAMNSVGGTFTKLGAGALTLAVGSTFTGGATLEAGTLWLGHDQALGSGAITLQGGAVRASGSARTLANAVNLAGSFTLGRDLHFDGVTTLQSDVTITSSNETSGAATTSSFNGAISGNHAITLAQGNNGTGAIVFGGSNSYTGNTTLTGGTLSISSNANLGAASSELILNGGTLLNTQDILTSRQVRINGNGGVLDVNAGYLTFTSAIAGAGGLTKTGGNILTLTSAQTYAGGTAIQQGSLKLENGSLQSPWVTVATDSTFYLVGPGSLAADVTGSGTLDRSGSGTTVLTGAVGSSIHTRIENNTLQIGDGGTAGMISGNVTNHGTLAFNRSDTVSFASTILGTGSVQQDGTGMVVLSGSNSYSGGFTLNSGIVGLGSNSALGSGLLTINGGFIRADGSARDVTNAVALNGSFSLGRLTELSGHLTLGADITITSANIDPNISTTTLSGTISGNHSLTFTEGSNPTGKIILSGSNSYSGGTILRNGVVAITADSALGSGSLTVGNGTLETNGTITTNRTVTVTGNGVFEVTSGTLTIESGITGAGALTKTGVGTQILTGANAYTGGTVINAGTLQIGNGGTTGSIAGHFTNHGTLAFNRSASADSIDVGSITGTGSVNINDGKIVFNAQNTFTGNLHLNGGWLGIGSNSSLGESLSAANRPTIIANGGGIRADGSPRTIVNDIEINSALSLGRLTNLNGPIQLNADATIISANVGPNIVSQTVIHGTISGNHRLTFTEGIHPTGEIILSGANTYSGETVINAGKVLVNGSIAGAATVQAGGLLGGSGVVGGAVTVDLGGTLSPGNSPGQFTLEDNLTMEDGSLLIMEFAGIAFELYDRLEVKGIFTAGGTLELTLIDGFVPFQGASFTIFNGLTPGFDTGSFEIATNLGSGLSWDISDLANHGIVSVIPEPSTGILLLIGAAGIYLRRKRGSILKN